MNKTRHVVIGTSASAIGALSKIRTIDKDSEVICISAAREMPFNTCLLADYLSGIRSKNSIFTKPQSFFDQNDINFMLATSLECIIPEEKKILLSYGKELSYDTLFLGIGTTIRRSTIPGTMLEGVFYFHTLNDVDAISDFMQKNNVKKTVVVGAGLSGVECADALVNRGLRVDLVEWSDRVLSRHVDKEGSRIIEDHMQNAGVTFHPDQSLFEIVGDRTVSGVIFENGKALNAQIVVFAIGATVNSGIAKYSGIELFDKRIKVDEYMQTSISGIYAGGDVCALKDMVTSKLVPNTTWPDAMMQGMVAGINMAGKSKKYPGVLTITSSIFFDLSFVSCGPVNDLSSCYKSIIKKGDGFYHKFIMEKDRLCGFLMVGKVDNVGILRKLVINKEPFIRSFGAF